MLSLTSFPIASPWAELKDEGKHNLKICLISYCRSSHNFFQFSWLPFRFCHQFFAFVQDIYNTFYYDFPLLCISHEGEKLFSHSITLNDTKHIFTEHSKEARDKLLFSRFFFIRRRSFVFRRINRFVFTLIFLISTRNLWSWKREGKQNPLDSNCHNFHHIHHSCWCFVFTTLKNLREILARVLLFGR